MTRKNRPKPPIEAVRILHGTGDRGLRGMETNVIGANYTPRERTLLSGRSPPGFVPPQEWDKHGGGSHVVNIFLSKFRSQFTLFEVRTDEEVCSQGQVRNQQVDRHPGGKPDQQQPGGVERVPDITVQACGGQLAPLLDR